MQGCLPGFTASLSPSTDPPPQTGLFSLVPWIYLSSQEQRNPTKAGLGDWGDSSFSKMLAVQTAGPEFNPQNPQSLMRWLMLEFQELGGRERSSLGDASLNDSVSFSQIPVAGWRVGVRGNPVSKTASAALRPLSVPLAHIPGPIPPENPSDGNAMPLPQHLLPHPWLKLEAAYFTCAFKCRLPCCFFCFSSL